MSAGFYLGKYKTVQDIPEARQRAFYKQVRVMLMESYLAKSKYDDSYKHMKFGVAWSEPEPEDYQEWSTDWKDCNKSNGDKWVADIISQRQRMTRKAESDAYEKARFEAERLREAEERKRENYEMAMDRSTERDKEREQEQVMHRYRLGKAAIVSGEIRRKIIKKRQHDAVLAKNMKIWEEENGKPASEV